MSTTLRFRDHAEFHRAAWQMASAGALAGLLAHLMSRGAPAVWALATVAAATVFGALAPALRMRTAALAGALALRAGAIGAGALALALLSRAGEPAVGAGVFAGSFGLALAWGLSGRRLAVAIGTGAAGALLARHVYGSVLHAQELSALPGWTVTAIAGAGFSFVSVLGLLPRHVELHHDRVAETYAALTARSGLAGEVRELCDRGYGLWLKAASSLDADDPNGEALAEGVTRLLEVAGRWSSINAEVAQAGAAALVDRMESLDARIAGTQDDIARAQYAQAKSALAEQLRYLKDIGTSRERVLARMHNYVAAMERLHLAVVNLESTNASRDAGAVKPLMTDLAALGADIDSCADALVDAERLATSS